MKFLKILVGIFSSIIALLIILTFFLPSEAKVTRSIEIKSSAERIFPLVNSMKNWEKWSPWCQIDSAAKWTYPGKEHGIGSIQNWKSDKQNLGSGQIEIIESKPYSLIKTKLQFFGNDFGIDTWTFKETNGTTKVTREVFAELSFFERWLALGIDEMLGPLLEKSLANIKKLCEDSENKETQ